jgi:thiamine biosynthesis lipoprotein
MREVEHSPTSYRFEAIGTTWRIDSSRDVDESTRAGIARIVSDFDRTWSRFRDDSVVADIARTSGEYRLPPEAKPLFDFYEALYSHTQGRITPLVGSVLEHLGYDRAYSLTPQSGAQPPIPAWENAVSFTNGILSVPKPVVLDIGAAGKGLLVDLVASYLTDHGHTECVVDASGDMKRHTTGATTERVALENPTNPARAVGVVELGHSALAASGTNRRRWSATLHHVIDGITGIPTTGVQASWVLAAVAMVADGCATALLVAEPETIARHFDIEWAIMTDNGQMRSSDNFPGELFV